MISTLVTAGGLVFWVIMTILALIIAGTGTKSMGWGSFWLAVTGVFLFGFTDFEFNLTNTGIFVLAYLGTGIVVSTLKWIHLVRSASKLISNQDIDPSLTPEEIIEARQRYAYSKFRPEESFRSRMMRLPPNPREFGPQIGRWVVFWPGFLVERVLDFGFNFVSYLASLGRKMTVGLFDTISRKLY